MTKIHLISGKGGVGKSAYAKSLLHLNPKYKFAYIKKHSLNEFPSGESFIPLEKEAITQEYIQRILKSSSLAKWIYHLSLFQSIFNMLPFMELMIYLGKIIDYFEEDPHHAPIILDAPASGHFLTMMRSFSSFQSMTKKGALFQDAKRMLDFLQDPRNIEIHFISQPMELDIQELKDFQQQIQLILPEAPLKLICNKSLFANTDLKLSLIHI